MDKLLVNFLKKADAEKAGKDIYLLKKSNKSLTLIYKEIEIN
jgi:hypothetical protein